jgi:hypothetical protein
VSFFSSATVLPDRHIVGERATSRRVQLSSCGAREAVS